MPRKALVMWGGWEGHQPQAVARLFERVLKEEGFDVELADTLDVLSDEPLLKSLDLFVPHWTMGRIAAEKLEPVLRAIEEGVGLAGVHGGMCDAFRDRPEWHFATGGQWVSHPGNDTVRYTVRITDTASPITAGISSFDVTTEQYYLLVDPAVKVLATTRFPVAAGPHVSNGPVDMPVVWTKRYGRGKVYYNSLGHTAAVLEQEPVLTLVRRGFSWAAKGD